MHECAGNYKPQAAFIVEPSFARPSVPAGKKGDIQLELGEERTPLHNRVYVRRYRGEAALCVRVGRTDVDSRQLPVAVLDAYFNILNPDRAGTADVRGWRAGGAG